MCPRVVICLLLHTENIRCFHTKRSTWAEGRNITRLELLCVSQICRVSCRNERYYKVFLSKVSPILGGSSVHNSEIPVLRRGYREQPSCSTNTVNCKRHTTGRSICTVTLSVACTRTAADGLHMGCRCLTLWNWGREREKIRWGSSDRHYI
jgi:hypothetical protein